MLAETYDITCENFQTTGFLLNYAKFKDAVSLEQVVRTTDSSKKKFEHLLEEIESKPEDRKRCADLRKSGATFYALSDRAFVELQREGPLAGQAWRHQIAQEASKYSDQLSSLAMSEQPLFKASLPDADSMIFSLFGLMLVVSTLVAILLGYLYATGIRRPLKRITANSVLLSQGKPLLPALKGADELAKLDRMFHAVADSVSNVAAKERAIIDNAAELICSLDRNGLFTGANLFSWSILSVAPEFLIGRSLLDFVVAEDIVDADDRLRQACASSETEVFDLRLRGNQGSVTDSRWSCFWSSSRNCLFCVAADVTEQKNIERLKEDFVNMISHDLRSPLMSMLGSMELIQRSPDEIEPQAAQEVAIAANNIDKLVAFVNDLLDFQGLKEGKMPLHLELCDLHQVVAEAAEMLQSLSQSKSVSISTQPGRWITECDRQKLVQTTMNLLANAIKFSPPKTAVSVGVVETDDGFEISVADQGPGVPAAMQQRIFEAFEQVASSPKSKEGTGLGLAICKLIVEAHGGTIGVRGSDSSGNGSVFWFRLPKKTVEAAPGMGLR